MVIRLVVIILLMCCFTACSSQAPLRVRKSFTFCYDSTTNYSGSQLKFNGYYIKLNAPYEVVNYGPKGEVYKYEIDSTFSNMMFFSDGIWVKGQTSSNRNYYDLEHLKYLMQEKASADTDYFYNLQRWGLYEINGDTLKLQCVSHQKWPNPYWHFSEVWYLLLDEKTLKPIYARDSMNDKASNIDSSRIVNLEFVETNLKLSSDTWLKKEEWFWCK